MISKTKVILRADGDSRIGLGHVHRSLALGQILRDHFDCTFAIKQPSAKTEELIRESCSAILKLTDDAEFFSALTGDEIVVLDGYQFSTDYQRKVKEKKCPLVSIDDIHSFHFVSDVILNPSGGVPVEAYSKDPESTLLLGPSYLLLKQPFRDSSKKRKDFHPNQSLFICMGGADPDNHSLAVLEKIEGQGFNSIFLVVGEAYRHRETLSPALAAYPNLTVLTDLNSFELRDIMKKCSVAICSASGVAYEYLSVGGELYLVQTATNQHHLNKFLIDSQLAFPFEKFRISEAEARQALQKNSEILDGHADQRILKVFNQLELHRFVSIRKAVESDLMLLFDWANDPESRKQSYSSNAITIADHRIWFSKKISDPGAYIYILEFKTIPFALVRFDVNQEALISYSLDKNFRGRGWATPALDLAIESFKMDYKKSIKLVGYVKRSNESSVKTFQHLNFSEVEASEYADSYKFEYLLA